MPIPQLKEPRDDFVSRCVPIVMKEPGTKGSDHAVAKCNGIWEQSRMKTINEGVPFTGQVLNTESLLAKEGNYAANVRTDVSDIQRGDGWHSL